MNNDQSSHRDLQLSHSSAVPLTAAAVAVGMIGWIAWLAVVHPDRVRWTGTGPRPSSAVVVLFLLVAVGAFGYAVARLTKARRVSIVGNRLLIRGFASTANVPLEDLTSVVWIHKPTDPDDTPLAALILQRPCRFGDQIDFIPRSVELVEELRATLTKGRLSVLPPLA